MRRSAHVWIQASGAHVPVLIRPLPATIGPRQQWETYVQVAAVGDVDATRLARAQLAEGDVVESEPRTDVVPIARPLLLSVRVKLQSFAAPFYGPLALELLPGRVSHGCIRLRNEDILRLEPLLPVGTPVTVS